MIKKILTGGLIVFFLTGVALAQAAVSADNHTVQEEAQGKVVWEKLQAKQVKCSDLSNDDFGVLGEYFMGQMTGTSHEAMNTMMKQMMGKEGEEQMHVAMGKRLSGCDTSATFPSQGSGFMPMMMTMMGQTGFPQTGGGMMNYDGWGCGYGIGVSWGWFAILLVILLWVGILALIFLGVVKLWQSVNKESSKK